MRQALIGRGFNVTVVADPTNSELHQALSEFLITYGGRYSDSRLLVYFIGHGHMFRNANSGRDEGYLVSRNDVPVNSPQGERKFRTGAVPISMVRNLAESIQAKHTLFMLDAAFSGHAIPNEEPGPSLYPDEYVVQGIIAGEAYQMVPAKSTFTEAFLEAITTTRADDNGDGLLTGTELGSFLFWQVYRASSGHQTPHASKLSGGPGDFVFRVPRDNP